jgi:hypothetical protein
MPSVVILIGIQNIEVLSKVTDSFVGDYFSGCFGEMVTGSGFFRIGFERSQM